MKVSIHAYPRFYLTVELQLVIRLIGLSKRHYDGECQRASAWAGAPLWPGSKTMQAKNGILRIWKNRFDDTGLPVEVSMDSDQLDLVAKICEDAPVDFTDVLVFRGQLQKLYEVATKKVVTEWKLEIEV